MQSPSSKFHLTLKTSIRRPKGFRPNNYQVPSTITKSSPNHESAPLNLFLPLLFICQLQRAKKTQEQRLESDRIIMESRNWMILVASIWIQAFTGTNLDFSSYSSDLKSVLQISQLQLNYLSVASDTGKLFGWCSGVSLMHLPLWIVMFSAAFLGVVGYGFQWLVIRKIISLPYIVVFLLCLVAGCSVCWFNTVCYVLSIRNFPATRSLALSLSIAFNGVSAAIFTLIANAINSNDVTLYLFLNAILPLLISVIALVPILRQPPPQAVSMGGVQRERLIFFFLYILALLTGVYLLLLDSISSNATWARVLLVGAIFLLALPLIVPGFVRKWTHHAQPTNLSLYNWILHFVELDDVELREELITGNEDNKGNDSSQSERGKASCFVKLIEKNQLTMLGEEHSIRLLLGRWDFWLYYIAYLCGATIGLVYCNNLGQISQSLGLSSQTDSLVTLYSSCSFFGRLLAAAPEFLRKKIYFARTGWLSVALVPTPIAFILLAISGSEASVRVSTALIGLSSGFVVCAAVSVTSELFGPNSVGVNHNILITNIPIGSSLFGLLAAVIYDSNGSSSTTNIWLREMVMCMGRKCYLQTFIWWGFISLVGLVSCFLLFLRTRTAYYNFQKSRDTNGTQTSS